jgi:hypothetical protein
MTPGPSPVSSSLPPAAKPLRRLVRPARRLIIPVAIVSVVAVIALTVLIVRPAGKTALVSTPVNVHPITAPLSVNSAITQENLKPGTTQWQLDPAAHLFTIQGYAGAVSALPGESVPLYISSSHAVNYDLAVYRLGWYGGAGAHLYAQATDLHSTAQGYWLLKSGLVDCLTCYSDPTTHLVEPRWHKSYELAIGADWPSGVYLIKLTAADQGESYIPLVVRAAHSHAAALVNLPVNTYQAYNLWGDYSVYAHYDKTQLPGKAVKITFDRPYERSAGASDLLSWDVLSIRWLERNGLDATYTTDVDLDASPASLLAHRIFIDLGHDEYWSRAMRDGVAAAQSRGVSMAFFGANDDYWQMRYEPDSAGQARRTFVCYKVATKGNPKDPASLLKADPMYAKQPNLTTAEWADSALHQPAEQLIGLRYQGYFPNTKLYLPDWRVTAPSAEPIFEGTGLAANLVVPHGLLGYEVDGASVGDHNLVPYVAPANLVILATSQVKAADHSTITANTAYFRAASGAFIFDAGSIWWCYGLDTSSATGASYTNQLKGSPAIERLTANVIVAMLAATPSAPAAS